MPSHRSRAPSKSSVATTVRTVDDVFESLSQYESKNGEASYNETVRYVKGLCKGNEQLCKDSIDTVSSPSMHFAPIVAHSSALLQSMFETGAILGGYQATAFFCPIVTPSSAAWEFFVSKPSSFRFTRDIAVYTSLEKVEEMSSDTGLFAAHYRGYSHGTKDPINVKVYVCDGDPRECILSYRSSLQQSFVSPSCAVCFWPGLTEKYMFRYFKDNEGTTMYPTGSAVCRTVMQPVKRVSPRAQSIRIYTPSDKHIQVVTFPNEVRDPRNELKSNVEWCTNIVFAAGIHSTRILGSVGGLR